jgi:tRNA pseudouridine38-40 synthase
MRVLLQIEYDGTNYHGWQSQKNGNSVQQTLQECLQGILCQPITLVASGRTDSGVHAKNQYAHFDYDGKFDVKKLPYALQGSLSNDISVKNAWIVSDNLHARYSVKSKTYHYYLYAEGPIQPLKERYCVYIKKEPNLHLIKRALKYLIGTHHGKNNCGNFA